MNEPREYLPAYALGLLTDADKTQVETALAASADLRAELESLLAVIERLNHALPPQAPPPALRAKIIQAAQAPRPLSMWRWLALAAVFALFFGLFWLITQFEPESAPPPLFTVALTGDSGAQGELAIDFTRRTSFLRLQNLADPPPDQTYQIWLLDPQAGNRISWGLFRPQGGKAELELALPADFERFRALGVTLEPVGGSVVPTGPSIVRGAWGG